LAVVLVVVGVLKKDPYLEPISDFSFRISMKAWIQRFFPSNSTEEHLPEEVGLKLPESKTKERKIPEIKGASHQWECPTCTYFNALESEFCEMCMSERPSTFSTLSETEKCVFCNIEIPRAELNFHLETVCEHMNGRSRDNDGADKVKCDTCGKFMELHMFAFHAEDCEARNRKASAEIEISCDYCKDNFNLKEFAEHIDDCERGYHSKVELINCEICSIALEKDTYFDHIEDCISVYKIYRSTDATDSQIFSCPFCRTKYAICDYKAHVLKCGGSISMGVSTGKVEGEFICPLCTLHVSSEKHDEHLKYCQEAQELALKFEDTRKDDIEAATKILKPALLKDEERKIEETEEEEEKVEEVDFLVPENETEEESLPMWKSWLQRLNLNKSEESSEKPAAKGSVVARRHRTCLKVARGSAAKKSKAARVSVLGKLKKIGETEETLQKIEDFIRTRAPAIVHVHLDKYLSYLIKDTHYRNQFETTFSSGCKDLVSRRRWEEHLFPGAYPEACPKFERPKYGTFNFSADKQGVNCCNQYGNSYFLLANHMRSRCTVTNKDSSNSDCLLGTLDNCLHLVDVMSDAEFKELIKAVNGKTGSSRVQSTYFEIQIHGPVELACDIKHAYVNSILKSNSTVVKQLDQFKSKFNVNFSYV